MDLPQKLQEKMVSLQEIVRGYRRVAIAFSGGADSSLLLKVAYDVLGENTLALFADSQFQPEEERHGAIATAGLIGASIDVVTFDPFALPLLILNSKLRCYHCKRAIFSQFIDLARQRQCLWLADGTNFDDLSQDRPGILAIKELGVQSPLAQACLTKSEVRLLSHHLGLPTWDKPSASCLATRIPTDTPITAMAVAAVDQAERILHGLGYQGCRVRIAASAWYLELAEGDIERLVASSDLGRVRAAFFALGANKVFLDLLERASILA